MENNQITELTTHEFIQTQVVKFKSVITDEIINAKKDELLALKINGLDDVEGYKIVHEKLNKLVKVRTSIEAKRKELLLISKTYDAAVNGEAKRLTELAAPVELHLKTQKSQIDGERERLEAIERQRIENEKRLVVERFNKRTQDLFNCGAMFNGSAYVLDGTAYRLGKIDISNDLINTLQDIIFDQHLAVFKELKKNIDIEILKNTPETDVTAHIKTETPAINIPEIKTASLFDQPADSLTGSDHMAFKPVDISFNNGFNAALISVVKILSGEEKFTRAQLIEKINLLKK
jgi:hypothetical protein